MLAICYWLIAVVYTKQNLQTEKDELPSLDCSAGRIANWFLHLSWVLPAQTDCKRFLQTPDLAEKPSTHLHNRPWPKGVEVGPLVPQEEEEEIFREKCWDNQALSPGKQCWTARSTQRVLNSWRCPERLKSDVSSHMTIVITLDITIFEILFHPPEFRLWQIHLARETNAAFLSELSAFDCWYRRITALWLEASISTEMREKKHEQFLHFASRRYILVWLIPPCLNG